MKQNTVRKIVKVPRAFVLFGILKYIRKTTYIPIYKKLAGTLNLE